MSGQVCNSRHDGVQCQRLKNHEGNHRAEVGDGERSVGTIIDWF